VKERKILKRKKREGEKMHKKKEKGIERMDKKKKMFTPPTNNNGNGDSRAFAHGVGGDNEEMQTKRPR
jgi:hypothetical protein